MGYVNVQIHSSPCGEEGVQYREGIFKATSAVLFAPASPSVYLDGEDNHRLCRTAHHSVGPRDRYVKRHPLGNSRQGVPLRVAATRFFASPTHDKIYFERIGPLNAR